MQMTHLRACAEGVLEWVDTGERLCRYSTDGKAVGDDVPWCWVWTGLSWVVPVILSCGRSGMVAGTAVSSECFLSLASGCALATGWFLPWANTPRSSPVAGLPPGLQLVSRASGPGRSCAPFQDLDPESHRVTWLVKVALVRGKALRPCLWMGSGWASL